jgi:hypothetical protein
MPAKSRKRQTTQTTKEDAATKQVAVASVAKANKQTRTSGNFLGVHK